MKELIRIYGIVQGVGFRPFVANLAREFRIRGSVSNRGSFVEIFAVGNDLENFRRSIVDRKPTRSIILQVEFEAVDFDEPQDFQIVESEKSDGTRFVSPDIAICDDCTRELFDKNDRRFLHPFINCTNCGPRFSIIDSMPYDRIRTTMKDFPMCSDCSNEYEDPTSRRYDAQPICCNNCGPDFFLSSNPAVKNLDAIRAARKILQAGGIVAVKGIGGFHLACDATNSSAVQKLRDRKHRPAKSFAVMFRNLEAVEKYCEVTDVEKRILVDYQKPILLLPKKTSSTLSELVAPRNNKLGTFLPYAPIHLLLFELDFALSTDALIMTSGNISGSPICAKNSEAVEFLSTIADEILLNDREILLRSDDSVADVFEQDFYMIRRSRGFSPLPIHVKNLSSKKILALGADLKNSFSVSDKQFVFTSPYIGDLSDLRSVAVLEESIDRMLNLFEIEPELIACDLHPNYESVKIAETIAEKKNVPLVKIQHHHAHIAACMAENNFAGDVIGVAFDGTGFGLDGSIWGGEIFAVKNLNFDRKFSISPFIHAGGDLASIEGERIANSMLIDLFSDAEDVSKKLGLNNFRAVKFLREHNINCVKSSSCGRLFDAVSAVLNVKKVSTFEGEAAMNLQNVAEKSDLECPKFSIDQTHELFRWLIEKKLSGIESEKLSYIFHQSLAEMIFEACLQIRSKSNIETVALSGGTFQNTLLLKLTKDLLESAGFRVLIHHLVPPNDGGISLGQIFLADRK